MTDADRQIAALRKQTKADLKRIATWKPADARKNALAELRSFGVVDAKGKLTAAYR